MWRTGTCICFEGVCFYVRRLRARRKAYIVSNLEFGTQFNIGMLNVLGHPLASCPELCSHASLVPFVNNKTLEAEERG